MSGSSTFTYNIAKMQAALGHDVTVITTNLRNSPEFEEIEKVKIYRIKCFKLPRLSLWFNFEWMNFTFFPSNLKKIYEIVSQINPDIINLHNHMFDLGFSVKLISRKFKIPYVITMHTIMMHANRFYNAILKLIDFSILRPFIVRGSEALICPDFNVKLYCENMYSSKANFIVPYGVELWSEPEAEIKKSLIDFYGLKGKKLIVSLGHIHANRDRKELIEAMPALISKFPNILLLIVGMVGIKDPVIWVETKKLKDYIIFTGALSHKESMGLLELASIEAHWLNQDKVENTSLGIASLEAMSAGIPVITSANMNSYGSGVLVSDQNIINVESRNSELVFHKISEILNNPEKAKSIGSKAKETISKNFSWKTITSSTLDIYEKFKEEKGN